MPPPHEDAISRSTLSTDGFIHSTIVSAAEAGVEYAVLTACDGDPQQMLRFSATVDDVETTSGIWGCADDTIFTVLPSASGGERVAVQLEVLEAVSDEAFSASVEVVPVPWSE